MTLILCSPRGGRGKRSTGSDAFSVQGAGPKQVAIHISGECASAHDIAPGFVIVDHDEKSKMLSFHFTDKEYTGAYTVFHAKVSKPPLLILFSKSMMPFLERGRYQINAMDTPTKAVLELGLPDDTFRSCVQMHYSKTPVPVLVAVKRSRSDKQQNR